MLVRAVGRVITKVLFLGKPGEMFVYKAEHVALTALKKKKI